MQPVQAVSAIQIETFPLISELLWDLFRQLQLAGLFVAYYEAASRDASESFLELFGSRVALLHSVLTAAETFVPGKVSLSGIPTIYNRAQWSDATHLGGYAGRDVNVKASELIASYAGCWQHAVQYPDSAPFRFVRLGLWYWREHGDALAALALLLDLYQTGFFLRQQHFGAAALGLCDAYTQGLDIGSLKAVDFRAEEADSPLAQALNESSKNQHSIERAQELVGWLSERAMDESDLARNASMPDDWIVQEARLAITVGLLHTLDKRHSSRLAGLQRAITSQFEEVRADLGGESLTTRMIAKEGRPLLVRLLGIQGVGYEYQRTYGADWLDKMLEDRVIAPNALRGRIAAAYQGADLPAVREFEIPREWRMISASIAWPFCSVFGRDTMLERSEDFDKQAVVAMCRELGYSPEKGSTGSATGDFSSTALAAARRELSINRLSTVLGDESLFQDGDPAGTISRLEKIADLYPWNHIIRRELGIRNDQSGNVDEGYRQMRAAVLLDPTDALNWRSLGVVLQRIGKGRDATFAGAISQMISEKESK